VYEWEKRGRCMMMIHRQSMIYLGRDTYMCNSSAAPTPPLNLGFWIPPSSVD
jgi:hypothetical protein